MWFKIRFVQIGHVDLDEILITMNLLKTKQNKTLLFIVTHALKRHFSNEGTICRIKHPENLEVNTCYCCTRLGVAQ